MADPADNDRPAPDDEARFVRPVRSLWDVMGHDAEDGSATAPEASSKDVDESVSPDGLSDASDDDIEFAEATPELDLGETPGFGGDSASEPVNARGETVHDDNSAATAEAGPDEEPGIHAVENLGEYPDLSVSLPTELPAFHATSSDRKKQEPATLALAFGVSAATFSLLCLLPVTALRMLPAISGLAALVHGCLALAKRRSDASRRVVLFAGVGLSLGLVGLFAGPLWLNEAGDRWRHQQTSRIVTDHLEQVGGALDEFHNRHGRFPTGGSFVDSADGFPVGMHGWMTDLLPHLGYEQLSSQIDRRRPWSDPANGPALQTRVEPFLTPGTPYELTATGHAPAHFAGVGGRVETDFGSGDLGIFGRNSQVTRDDVIDGLSQTMVAGEIAQSIPAWGEPDNWRSIGPGLNQSPHGFGNAADSGAHFLMADGSVRFVSNRTSLRTLQRLSTRNGSESEGR